MSSGKPGRPRDKYQEQVYAALHEKYPKFGRVQLCMVRNPEYGLQMASGALSILRANGIPPPGKNKAENVKQTPKRKKEKRITIRLTVDQRVRLSELKDKSGCKSIQEYLEKLINEQSPDSM